MTKQKPKKIYQVKNYALYDYEVEYIEKDQWVNCGVLSFAGIQLELAANKSCDENHKNVMYFPGSIFYFVRTAQRNMALSVLKYWDFFKAKYILMPFNNGTDPSVSGDHWSLLIWDTNYSKDETSKFYFFNSMEGTDIDLARETAARMCEYYDVLSFEFIEKESPQQLNCFDCGMFVIAFMEQFTKSLDFDDILENVDQSYVTKLREEYLERYKPKED